MFWLVIPQVRFLFCVVGNDCARCFSRAKVEKNIEKSKKLATSDASADAKSA